ncbi:MAG: hypothetical protein WAR39_00805 [Prevotella sp.]
MQKIIFLMMFIFSVCSLDAQEEKKVVTLKDVEVRAARVINKPDGRTIIPSTQQIAASSSGYSLLNKLALPFIRVDEISRTVTALNQKGTVQIRINGIVATQNDLVSLDISSVKSIDFIESPGVRYGSDVVYVIDIHVKHPQSGYMVGFDGVNSVTTCLGYNSVFAKLNHRKSEFSVNYDFSYRDLNGYRTYEKAHYQFNDGSTETITRADESSRESNFNNNIQLRYSLADSASYQFQTTLSTAFDHVPNDFQTQLITTDVNSFQAHSSNQSNTKTPSLDLYYYTNLSPRQSVTSNVTGTYISSEMANAYDEGSPYAYQISGRTYSLFGEVVYENRLKPFTLSLGMTGNMRYTDNKYRGDVQAVNKLHHGLLYLFGDLKGKLAKLNYVTGLGVSNQLYQQADISYHFWLFRPKLTLEYPLYQFVKLKNTFEISQHLSQVANINDATIRQNSMEWTVGNPQLKPNSVMENTLTLAYDKPRLGSHFDISYRMNRHCNMAEYIRTDDNRFLYTQANQPGIQMFYVMNDTRYDIIPDVLTANVTAGVYRFINHGDDYKHDYTAFPWTVNIEAYLKKWTLSAYVDNGWQFMEGEMKGHETNESYLSVSYRLGKGSVSLYWQHPLQNNPRMFSSELTSSYIQKENSIYSRDLGNMVSVNFKWELSKGRKYKTSAPSMIHQEKDAGILK